MSSQYQGQDRTTSLSSASSHGRPERQAKQAKAGKAMHKCMLGISTDGSNMSSAMLKHALWSLLLSNQKEAWLAPAQHGLLLVWHRLWQIIFESNFVVMSYQKRAWLGRCKQTFLLIWQRQRPLGLFYHDSAQIQCFESFLKTNRREAKSLRTKHKPYPYKFWFVSLSQNNVPSDPPIHKYHELHKATCNKKLGYGSKFQNVFFSTF